MTNRANPWLQRRVLNFAHQGGAREAPSSTLLALHQAVAAGADALELDVHATADRHLVVCHDATVDRTTNGRGAIADLTLAEVGLLPATVVRIDKGRFGLQFDTLSEAVRDRLIAALFATGRTNAVGVVDYFEVLQRVLWRLLLGAP